MDTDLAFPLRIDGRGRSATATRDAHLRDMIEQLLFTVPGERVNRHAWGAGLSRFLYQPNTLDTHTLIARTISDAIAKWEPRVRLESVDDAADPSDPGAARAVVTYRLAATGEARRLPLSIPVNSQNPS